MAAVVKELVVAFFNAFEDGHLEAFVRTKEFARVFMPSGSMKVDDLHVYLLQPLEQTGTRDDGTEIWSCQVMKELLPLAMTSHFFESEGQWNHVFKYKFNGDSYYVKVFPDRKFGTTPTEEKADWEWRYSRIAGRSRNSLTMAVELIQSVERAPRVAKRDFSKLRTTVGDRIANQQIH